jgi:hypothetical protein
MEAPAAPAPFKIEAVIVCVNYADYLAHTLRENKILFDRVVVVTAPEDRETRRVCEYLHVECLQTDVTQSRWGKFCKGAAINVGLEALGKDGWVVHMDADIALPPLARRMLQAAELDPTFLYGCDRVMCRSFVDWVTFQSNPRLQHEDECWIHMDQFPFGHRVAINTFGGYIPIGFFQMWNPSVSGICKYPEGHTTAAREDTDFALKWPRNKRGFVPEIIAYHLESGKTGMSANWAGRTTPKFGLDKLNA